MKSTPWGDSKLADALSALRQAEARVETPPHVQAALLAAWDSAHTAPSGVRARNLWREVAAVAAAVTIAFGLAHLGRELRQTTLTSTEPVGDSRALLVVGEPILQGEPVRVVRMRVPVSTLTGLGVRPATGNATTHVDVDVIVGEDGIARAIRVGM